MKNSDMRLKMEDIYLYCRTCITRLIPQTNLFLILKNSTKSSAEATYSKKLFFFFFTSAQSCSNILNNRSRLRQKTNKYISWLHTARLVYFKSSEGLGCQTDWKRCFLHPFWVEIFTVSAELKVSVHTLSEVVKYGANFFYSCFFFFIFSSPHLLQLFRRTFSSRNVLWTPKLHPAFHLRAGDWLMPAFSFWLNLSFKCFFW